MCLLGYRDGSRPDVLRGDDDEWSYNSYQTNKKFDTKLILLQYYENGGLRSSVRVQIFREQSN